MEPGRNRAAAARPHGHEIDAGCSPLAADPSIGSNESSHKRMSLRPNVARRSDSLGSDYNLAG